MARKHRNEVLAGIFILVSSILFGLVLYLIGSFENLMKPMRTLTVYFDDVQQLREGDPVYLLGRKVGSVQSLYIEEQESRPPHVRVHLGIPEDRYNFITDGARVLIDKSLTGNLQVLILDLKGKKIANRDIALKGSVAFDMVQTAARIEQTLGKVTAIVGGVASMLENFDKSGMASSILADLRDTVKILKNKADPLTTKVDRIAENLDKILTENRSGIKETIDNLSKSALYVNRFMERIEPTRLAVEQAMNELKTASKDIDEIAVRNRGYINGILKDLREASATVNNLSSEIKRRPWRLLYKPDADEVETFDLYDAAWAYNLSATTLNLSVQELVSLSKNSDKVPPEVIERAVKNIRASLEKQKAAEDQFYTLFQEKMGI